MPLLRSITGRYIPKLYKHSTCTSTNLINTYNSSYNHLNGRSIGSTAGGVGEQYDKINSQYQQAVLLHKHGSARNVMSIDTIPIPQCHSHELLIKILAISINPLDSMNVNGYNYGINSVVQSMPYILGRECCGVVVGVGDSILTYNHGDIVWCSIDPLSNGCFSQYVIVAPNEVSHAPSTLDIISMSALPFSITTVWSALVSIGRLGPVKGNNSAPPLSRNYGPTLIAETENILAQLSNYQIPILPNLTDSSYTVDRPYRVFIHGGSGSIGTFAVQLLKLWGHEVIVTAHPSHHDRMVELGCDHVIDYTRHSWLSAFPVGSIDIFLDGVGGHHVEAQAEALQVKHFITLRGDLVNYVDKYGISNGILSGVSELIHKKLHWMTLYGSRYDWAINRPTYGALQYATLMANQTKNIPNSSPQPGLQPFVDLDANLRGLNDVITAIELMQNGKARNGKLVVELIDE